MAERPWIEAERQLAKIQDVKALAECTGLQIWEGIYDHPKEKPFKATETGAEILQNEGERAFCDYEICTGPVIQIRTIKTLQQR